MYHPIHTNSHTLGCIIPTSPQSLASAFIHVHYGLALYVDGTARRQAPRAGKALTHSRALPMIVFSCHDATQLF